MKRVWPVSSASSCRPVLFQVCINGIRLVTFLSILSVHHLSYENIISTRVDQFEGNFKWCSCIVFAFKLRFTVVLKLHILVSFVFHLLHVFSRSEVLSLLRNRWRSVGAWHCISASTQRNQRLPFTIDIWVPLGGVKPYILMWTKYINICSVSWKYRRVRSEGNNMYKQGIEKYIFFLQIHCCNLWWVLWLFSLSITCLTVYKYLVSI